jgi:hypothetical protein
VIAHVELVSDADEREKVEQQCHRGRSSRSPEEQARIERHILDPDHYQMTVTLAAELDDGHRVTAEGFRFGGPRSGVGAIWHRYRGPQLSDDPEENDRLLNETYRVGLPDIEDAINQMLGRDPDQQRPPRLSWNHLQDALTEVGIKVTEDELIVLPLNIELSEQVQAEIARV